MLAKIKFVDVVKSSFVNNYLSCLLSFPDYSE